MNKRDNRDIDRHVAFMIAAPTSHCGKSTVTAALLRAFKLRGLRVQPFKCGPDYIDPQLHLLAAGNVSVNLDTFLASPWHVREAFLRYGAGADVCIAEGAMGLYDGWERDQGSAASIASLLQMPVILVVDARAVAYSAAPLIHGFATFRKEPHIAGVIFNNVGSAHHYSLLRQACADSGIQCYGYLPRDKRLTIEDRHLGLALDGGEALDRIVSIAAEEAERHIDLDSLLKAFSPRQEESKLAHYPERQAGTTKPNINILIAHDEAFNFIYRANIDSLRRLGTVRFFSPLHDRLLPSPCDLLYLPGGYPELFAKELSANTEMRHQIADFAHNGGYIFAECGGFMYLCKSIDRQPLVSVFPMEATMQDARLHLGYRQMRVLGQTFSGHEFHYSTLLPHEPAEGIRTLRIQNNALGEPADTELFLYRNVIGGYTHWYWADKDIEELWQIVKRDFVL
ncbi:MAG: cobyrinate a,c-diamide synthase [Prevotellaceae bacterium]|nr:cobyrinate a,c-diamide synthase [Prevotellaceae bacterium]